MEQSWISVVDTAIKIGMGAFITAVSGYLGLKRIQSHEEEKEQRERFYKLQEEKKRIYVEFLSLSQSLVQSHLLTSCSCDTDEYKNYLRSFNEVQIISPDEVRLSAYNLLSATNEFAVINKNGLERELGKALRSNFDEKLGYFQKVVQIEVTQPYKKHNK